MNAGRLLTGRGHHFRCPRPECREPVRPEDRFCEACGHLLPPRESDVPSLAGTPLAPAPPADPGRVEIPFPDFAGVSDRGLKRRRNEDAVALARVEERRARVLVVCDGVATSAEPAQASQGAAQAALAYLLAAVRDGHPDLEVAMQESIAAAQEAVCRIPYPRSGSSDPPASTLVAALLQGRRATIGWVGDSRAYFLGDGDAWLLSQDDSWASEQVGQGLLSEEEAHADPRAHALTSWLGGDQEVGPQPSVSTFVAPGSGCLLLCTDGLWNCAPSPASLLELVTQLPADATPLEVALGLTEFARSSGGDDNITVAVAFM